MIQATRRVEARGEDGASDAQRSTSSSVAQRLHAETVVVEAHRDCYEQIYWTNMGEDNPVRDRLAPRLVAGGCDVVVYAIGGDTIAHSDGRDKKLLATIDNIMALRAAISSMAPPADIVLDEGDLAIAPDGRLRFVLHLEGGSPLEGSVYALEALHLLGVRSMQPTWNIRNELGDGVHERDTGSGLTRFGVAVLRRMVQLGMLVDLSHISESGFWHAVRTVDGPLAVTHANARALHDHPRNLTDEQIRAVADHGGVVGVHTLPTFVGAGAPGVDQLVDHVVHIAELVGVDHVGFGGDFVSCDGPRPPREALFHDPRAAPPTLPTLTEIHELPSLTIALLERGFESGEVAAVIGGNMTRLLRDVLPHR